jgi:hypothetical protein
VLEHGTGALNIDGCRVLAGADHGANCNRSNVKGIWGTTGGANIEASPLGRWPSNLVHDGSDEVVASFPYAGGAQAPVTGAEPTGHGFSGNVYGAPGQQGRLPSDRRDGGGSAARFFYSAKADSDDRLGSMHPTVKPVDLMQWLCRLVTPPGGVVLDPFAGAGSTGEAAWREGFRCVLIEREAEYQADIARRMALCLAGPDERKREAIKAKSKDKPADHGPLFSLAGPAE